MLEEWKWIESQMKVRWFFSCLVEVKVNRKWKERKIYNYKLTKIPSNKNKI
jgi:hypothetical protein